MDPARRPAALVRLNRYVGLEEGYTPLIDQHIAHLDARLAEPHLLGPVKDEIENDLVRSGRFVAGLQPLFEQYELEGGEAGLAALERQLAGWEEFLRTSILPRSRTDFRLPPELYAYRLRDRGVDMSVEELTSRAKVAFVEIQNEMQVLARLVAAERGLASSDYRDVIRELKKEQVSGEITREEAMRILQEEVVFSEAMALQEVERYTFDLPGQATSYFCGYSRLLELRADVERIQGDAFDQRAFHDFILAQGILPPSLIRRAVMEELLGR